MALRETLVEALSRTLRWGHMLDGLVAPLARCLDQAGTDKILDLCSGAGGPADVLCAAMVARGHRDVEFLMSDLFPAVTEWEPLCAKNPRLKFVHEPVDATRIPAHLGDGRVRLIINALHHFPPEIAREVLRGACEGAPAVFIAEGLVRNPLSFAAMGPMGIVALMATPMLARDRVLTRAAMTWLTPIALAASIWDGTVSSLRTYRAEELREMTSGLEGWTWTWGEYSHSVGLGAGNWFSGVRAE